jgi:hypothetical protein
MLPPRIENDRSNRNIVAATARSGGTGKGSRVRRPKAHAEIGNETRPLIATSLKATP